MDKEKAEQVVKLLRKMEHNCNKYAERHDKAEALSLAIDFIENRYSAVEVNDDENTNGNTIRPGYYQSAMGDVFDIADAYGLDMPLGTAAKYILRAGKKDKSKEIEDLEKAIRCIERAIELRRDQH